MFVDAKAALAKDQANYNSLKASCRGKEAGTSLGAVISGLGRISLEHQEGGMQEICLAAPGIDVCFQRQDHGSSRPSRKLLRQFLDEVDARDRWL